LEFIMARQEAQSKLLYYPMSDEVVDLISTWLSNPQPSRIADPCVGSGEALARLKAHLGDCETWGVEVSYVRAEQAKRVIDVVLPTSFYHVKWDDRTVSLALNNPPYDFSEYQDERGSRIRHERLFVTQMSRRIVTGGIHVIIIPRRMLADEELARYLVGRYEHVLAFAYPHSGFDQVVIFGVKRAQYQHPSRIQIEGLTALANPDAVLAELCPGDGRYILPAAPEASPEAFLYTPLTHAEQIRAAQQCSPLDTEEYIRALHVRPIGEPIHPVVQENIGHVSMELSSGGVGVLRIDTPAGPILTRGTTTKEVTEQRETVANDEGEATGEKVTQIEKLVTQVAVTHPDGRIEVLSTASEVGDFITQYSKQLCDALLARNVPQYAFQPTPREWAITRQMALGMPTLAGRNERGLFDLQAHFAIAATRVLRQHKAVIVNADMGTGKTLTSIAALEVLNQWPAIIMCPGHMTEKWRREITQGSNPAEPIIARVLDTGAKPAIDVLAKIRRAGGRILNEVRTAGRREMAIESTIAGQRSILAHCQQHWLDPIIDGETLTMSDEAVSEEMDASYDDGSICTWTLNVLDTSSGSHFHNLMQPLIESLGGEILQNERLQVAPEVDARAGKTLQSGRRRRLVLRLDATQHSTLLAQLSQWRLRPMVMAYEADTLSVEISDRDLYTLFDFVRDCEAGQLGRKAVAIVAFDAAKYDAGFRNITGSVARRIWDEGAGRYVIQQVQLCPGCGQVVDAASQEAGRCLHAVPKPIFDEGGRLARDENGEPLKKEVSCQTSLQEMSRWHRVGVSRLVRDQFAHWFRVYIMDEVHEAQAGDTDIGAADGRFISGTRYSIALTGTLFGGTASSIFYLLYRRVPEVRGLYGYREVGRWIQHYGAVKTTWTEKLEERTGLRGLSTGIQRYNLRVKELPRVHPGIIRYLLPQTLFAKITDLGYALPPLNEEIIRVEMGEALGSHFRKVDDDLRNYAAQQLAANKDGRWFSAWWNAVLRRPNSAFRGESFALAGAEGFTLPAVVDGADPHDLLPKEARLIELIRRNKASGRRTLVFVEQTATRDIRSRLQAALEANLSGLRVATLSSSVAPNKREA
jgi:hypothetical protein